MGTIKFYTVYVLWSSVYKRTYTGMTLNLKRRLAEHNSKINKSTKAFAPWELIYNERYTNRKDARDGEKYLKSGNGREFIKFVINRSRSSTG